MEQGDRKTVSFFQRLSAADKAAFLACVITGFLIHLYAFTNIIPNSDGLSRVYDTQQMTISGRWFLHFASLFHGYIQAPMLIGTLMVAFLALAAILVAEVLHLRTRWSGAFCGSFLVAFPSVAYTCMYLFTASAYAFGILLAVLSVWICQRWKWGMLPGAVVLACAVGTYQAYFAVAAALAMCSGVLDLMDPEKTPWLCLVRMLRSVAMLLAGAVLYYGVLCLFLKVKDLTLISYRGMDTFSISAMPARVKSAYWAFFRYFLMPGSSSYVTVPVIVAQLVLFLVGGVAAICQIVDGQLWKSIWRLGLLVAVVLLLPLGMNFSQLLAESSPVMRYAMVFAWILPLALLDRLPARRKKRLAPLFGCAAGLVLLLSAQTANTAYVASATAHRATQTFATNLVARVESLPGYENWMEVVIIGAFPDTVYHNSVEELRQAEHQSSCLASSVLTLNKHVYYYLNDWLNIPWAEPSETTMQAVSDSTAFQEMPLYPSDGSVAILDGRVVVRLAERYSPKRDYEIAYENRR